MVGNTKNHKLWPNVVSHDVLKHTGGLKGDVLVLSGQVKGKTFLPLPQQSDMIETTTIEELE
jgi:dynein heavy chain